MALRRVSTKGQLDNSALLLSKVEVNSGQPYKGARRRTQDFGLNLLGIFSADQATAYNYRKSEVKIYGGS